MIGTALRLVRDYHRLDQRELAGKLGISPSYLSELEKGKKKPSLELLEKYRGGFRFATFISYLHIRSP
ncbi:MAG: helix-turn-helix domain-containing protein [Gammaproteobacteria bacterium]|nr:helix-turn-helix domain-containing protein [Gammaproteobacteria bacterium]